MASKQELLKFLDKRIKRCRDGRVVANSDLDKDIRLRTAAAVLQEIEEDLQVFRKHLETYNQPSKSEGR